MLDLYCVCLLWGPNPRMMLIRRLPGNLPCPGFFGSELAEHPRLRMSDANPKPLMHKHMSGWDAQARRIKKRVHTIASDSMLRTHPKR